MATTPDTDRPVPRYPRLGAFAFAIAGVTFLAGVAWLLVPAIRERPARAAFATGMKLEIAGDLAAALQSYERAARLGLHTADFYYQYATLASRLGDLRKAEALYRTALEADGKFAPAHEGLAEVYFRQEAYEQAAEAYANAASLDSGRAAHLYVLAGNIYAGLKQKDKARRMYERAINSTADDEEARKGLEALDAAPPESASPR